MTVNIFALDSTPFHKEKITYMKARGPGCFDAAYYAAQSHDLQVLTHIYAYVSVNMYVA